MNGWKVDLSKSARKELRGLGDAPRHAAGDLIEDFREHGPDLVAALELRGYPRTWKIRFHQDQYRMIYQVSQDRKHIFIKRIRPRSTAYEGMKS